MADNSVGSVLQTDLPHDHRKAFSEEVRGEKWVLAYPMPLNYGLRLWFSDTADLTAGCYYPALTASLVLHTGVRLGSEVQGTKTAEAK